MSYQSSYSYSVDEINLIELAGLTIAELNDFYSRFPDQNLDTAIGGANAEKAMKAEGMTPGLEVSHEANPDAPAPAEEGPEPAEPAEPAEVFEASEATEAPVIASVEECEVPSVGETAEEEASGKDTPPVVSE